MSIRSPRSWTNPMHPHSASQGSAGFPAGLLCRHSAFRTCRVDLPRRSERRREPGKGGIGNRNPATLDSRKLHHFCTISSPIFALLEKRALIISHLQKELHRDVLSQSFGIYPLRITP